MAMGDWAPWDAVKGKGRWGWIPAGGTAAESRCRSALEVWVTEQSLLQEAESRCSLEAACAAARQTRSRLKPVQGAQTKGQMEPWIRAASLCCPQGVEDLCVQSGEGWQQLATPIQSYSAEQLCQMGSSSQVFPFPKGIFCLRDSASQPTPLTGDPKL